MIRQPVLDYQTYGKGDDAMGVVALGRGQIAGVGAEINLAPFAPVLGIDEFDVAWTFGSRIAEVV